MRRYAATLGSGRGGPANVQRDDLRPFFNSSRSGVRQHGGAANLNRWGNCPQSSIHRSRRTDPLFRERNMSSIEGAALRVGGRKTSTRQWLLLGTAGILATGVLLVAPAAQARTT